MVQQSDGDIDTFLQTLRREGAIGGGESAKDAGSGEKRLYLAVMEQAIRIYLGRKCGAQAEAEAWIKNTRNRGPFSFITACDILGLNAGAARQALRRLRWNVDNGERVKLRARLNVRRTGQLAAKGASPKAKKALKRRQSRRWLPPKARKFRH